MVYSTDRSKAVVLVLVLLLVALWFILRGDLFHVLPYFILFLCFSVLLVLGLPLLGKRKLILVLFVRLFDLCLFGFVGFLFSWCLGRAAFCDCGTPWTFLLVFFFFFFFFFCDCGAPWTFLLPFVFFFFFFFEKSFIWTSFIPDPPYFRTGLFQNGFIKYWQYLLWPNGGPDIPYGTPIK